jgi:hypothetical protein
MVEAVQAEILSRVSLGMISCLGELEMIGSPGATGIIRSLVPLAKIS